MKMKGLFALFAVFALAVCMAMPAKSARAAVHDDDVGFCQGTVIASNITDETFQMIAPAISTQSAPTMIGTCMEAMLNENGNWIGADSKSSRCEVFTGNKENTFRLKHDSVDYGRGTKRILCEAALSIKNYCVPIFPHRKFGKDIRRLSCES